MSEFLTVKELKAQQSTGKPFVSLLVLKKTTAKTASNGNPYLSAELADKTGSFTCTVFSDSAVFELFKNAGESLIVKVEGKLDVYQGRLAPKLSKATQLTEAEVQASGAMENLVEASSEDFEGMKGELKNFISSIAHVELKKTVETVFQELGDNFLTAPAAVSVHHAYRHGLLEHTIRMARAAKVLLPLYPEVHPDLVMAGILLHDTGKVIEYVGTLSTKRSRRGILQGHVVLGYDLARRAGLKVGLDADLQERLEHIILSHQGKLEWGAAVIAASPEAVLVSMIDNLDARMGMVQQALRQANEDQEFSERIMGLESPVLTKPVKR
jgi:3'-5' exoribonuclease